MTDVLECFTFRYLGMHNGSHAFRAPTWKTSARRRIDAVTFENAVVEWKLNEALGRCHIGNGSAHGYPELPMAFSTGSGLCVLLDAVEDVVAFEQTFRVSGLTPDRFLAEEGRY